MVIVILTRRDLRDEFAMADEAFALSPISARAELPGERDYDAIREAFMETARGRWFLGEYGKRNRNADTSMVLDAVARIEATIAAHKQAPANELPDALVLIRGLLSDAKDTAARTMSGPDAEAALAAVNKGTRIIREIAWTLREYGTDARICDMLDAQVNAIEASHQQTIAPDKREAVLAAFDLLIRRIGELGGSGTAAAWSASETTVSSSSSDNEAPAAMARSVETATAPMETASVTEVVTAAMPDAIDNTIQESAAQQALAEGSLAEDSLARGPLVQDALAQDAIAQDAIAQGAPAQDARAQDSLARISLAQVSWAQDSHPQDLLAQGSLAQDSQVHDLAAHEIPEATAQSSEAAAMTGASAEIAPPKISEQEVTTAADAEAAALDLEIAQDMAVLEAIALEMAEPEIAHPVDAGPQMVEPETVESGEAEPDIVERVPETAIAPEPEPEPRMPSQPSLGATLIASGIVSRSSAAHDALAPIRRMTQAERVAFFS
jgi:hypothetical protein